MDGSIAYRFIKPGEEHAVCDLVTRVFRSTVAPVVSPEGTAEVLNNFVQPAKMTDRLQNGRFAIVATRDSEIVGVIEIRDNSHISLFYTDITEQRKGIGRELLRRAGLECHHRFPTLGKMTVNATPNSTEAYKSLGFHTIGREQIIKALNVIPMALDLPRY
jgi:predicted GNAT family N-acyltransferase